MMHSWQNSGEIRDRIYIPKYYDPAVIEGVERLKKSHEVIRVDELIRRGWLSVSTGDEIGKAAYGTGDIPFVRTSDIANWEIKSAPKQGVSREIYDEYASAQDVQIGDILFVRDGTYLIGNNCFITEMDKDILYQSHVLKLRVLDADKLPPILLFLAINSAPVQKQIRSVQFTADIIDTIGQRFFELAIPIPKDVDLRGRLIEGGAAALTARAKGRAFIKHCPKMMETCLARGGVDEIERFLGLADADMAQEVSNETVSSELGEFTAFWWLSNKIKDRILLPKYYDIKIDKELRALEKNCDLQTFAQLREAGRIEYYTGDEIGKMAYETGTIPFLRTSDFANWEIFHNPKQGVSNEIYNEYASGQDVRENDILLVRDGTYLVGSSCIITGADKQSLFCGGLFKIRVNEDRELDPFLFLGLLNSYIVKRQFRSKQFTRDVIDTLGNRVDDVLIPIPRSAALRGAISEAVKETVTARVQARAALSALTKAIVA